MAEPSAWTRFTIYLITAILISCSPALRPNNGTGDGGKKMEFGINPKLQFYRSNNSELQLFFALSCDQLLFARDTEQSQLTARLKVTCTEFNSKTNETGWVETKTFSISKSNCNGRWLSSFQMNDRYNFIGEVLVKVEDLNRGSSYTAYSYITKERFDSQKYLCLDRNTETPILNDYYVIGDSLTIQTGDPTQEEVFISVFNMPSQAPAPAYNDNINSPKPELEKTIRSQLKDSRADLPITNSASIIEVRARETREELGLILNFFKPNYPALKDGLDMLNPLVYLCRAEEFNQLRAEPDARKAAEEFWIMRCKTKERARMVLGEYYRRVKFANDHYTSFVEGWKSDRGMIYLIYGKPESVSRRAGEEIWIYGREINTVRLSFTFRQVNNPFSFNHYELERNPGYKAIWELAVNTWRNGKIFSY